VRLESVAPRAPEFIVEVRRSHLKGLGTPDRLHGFRLVARANDALMKPHGCFLALDSAQNVV
jgi:hypothetical protein